MNSDRGIKAAAGVVFAFALLWSVAILIPDDRGRSVVRVRPNSRKLKVTNNKYSLVTNNIASSTSTRVSSFKFHYVINLRTRCVHINFLIYILICIEAISYQQPTAEYIFFQISSSNIISQ